MMGGMCGEMENGFLLTNECLCTELLKYLIFDYKQEQQMTVNDSLELRVSMDVALFKLRPSHNTSPVNIFK